MKRPYTINALASDPSVAVGLTWDADVMYVYNPTKYTVLIRQGSNSRPASTLDADIVCAPVSALALPVASREFFVTLTTPTLPLAPEGMPTSCNVTFMKGEPPVAFGSIPLAGGVPSRAQLLANLVAGPIGATVITPPAAFQRLDVVSIGPAGSTFTLVGNTSGYTYLALAGLAQSQHAAIVISSALDASYTIQSGPGAGVYALIVTAWGDPSPVGMYGGDGRQMVDVLAPGAATVPVLSVLPVPVSVVAGALVAPAANALIVTTPALAAGTYRVEIDMMGSDALAVGNYMIAALAGGPLQSLLVPPGSTSFVWSDIVVGAGGTVEVRKGFFASGAGSLYSGCIRAYKLS